MKQKPIVKFIPCLYGSFIIGMVALEIGVLLPYLMQSLHMNYTLAGGMLSLFAVGNFLASPINTMLLPRLGPKKIVLLFSVLTPLCFLALIYIQSVTFLYLLVMMIGIARGTISIYVYSVANRQTDGKSMHVFGLSIIFAIGALAAPLLTSFSLTMGLGWKQVIVLFVFLTLLVPILLGIQHEDEGESKIVKELVVQPTNSIYYKNMSFYLIGMIMFFYLGLENCVNGWFVRYFKDMNIMSNSYANSLVSITWLFVIIGRITSAYLSSRVQKKRLILMNCLFASAFFLLLISTKQLPMITISIVGLGFFCAGIYPMCIASVGTILNGSTSGMAMLLAMAALGGIITPQIVGVIADQIGLTTAIVYLVFHMICMIAFSVIYYGKKSLSEIENKKITNERNEINESKKQ
jgi:fucose permease